MRAKDFLREYSREKTASVFGNKLVAALQNDRSPVLSGTALGTARQYLQQKAKVNDPINEQNKSIIINDIMQTLENADPTANKEYVQWFAKVYANEGIMMEDILSKGRPWIEKYDLYKKKRFFKGEFANLANIMNLRFKDLADVSDNHVFQNMLDQQEEKSMSKGDAVTVYENSQVRIIKPNNQEAACYYGQGTRWCTAATGSYNYFDRYNSEGPMYILLPKQPKYEGEKYQLHFSSQQFMDEGDNSVDIINLLDMRFGGDVAEFFMEQEPVIKDWLVFTPEEILEPLIAKIKIAVSDYVNQIINDWESDDEYWWEYLRDKGYVYPEGHDDEGQIDWDKVADADESYTDWNYDAADFISRIVGAVDLSPREVKELAQEVSSEWGADYQEINDLDKIMVYSIEQTNNRNRGDAGVSEWISEHIYVTKKDGQWDVKMIYTDGSGKRKEYEIG